MEISFNTGYLLELITRLQTMHQRQEDKENVNQYKIIIRMKLEVFFIREIEWQALNNTTPKYGLFLEADLEAIKLVPL